MKQGINKILVILVLLAVIVVVPIFFWLIKDNTFTIEIAHDVRIEVDKAAISFNEATLNQPKNDNKAEDKKENE